MITCSFELNGKPSSLFWCDTLAFEAFSGAGSHVNRRESACLVGVGPIPPGRYYILERESNGLLAAMRDHVLRRSDWFALYADDGRVDDETFCDGVRRGEFRLHPIGPSGISRGCIVIRDAGLFPVLAATIRRSATFPVRGTRFRAFGELWVR